VFREKVRLQCTEKKSVQDEKKRAKGVEWAVRRYSFGGVLADKSGEDSMHHRHAEPLDFRYGKPLLAGVLPASAYSTEAIPDET
jgi:hypothetical protein